MKKYISALVFLVSCAIGLSGCTQSMTANPIAVNESSLTAEKTAFIQSEDWRLLLINRTHPIPEDTNCELAMLSNGRSVDTRILPDLQEMFDDARAEGIRPIVGEGFRTRKQQQDIMNRRIADYIMAGYPRKDAEKAAASYVALPGTSEHELGLAVDINAENGDSSSVYSWLAENAWKYGFILRYPEGKEQVTGISYEPWHYRYVGKDAAREIYAQQITLEEYLGA